MPFKIVRNDITKMNTEAIVNTANDHVSVGTGCDYAVYAAAGHEELLKYREENIGFVPEGDAFITPGFKLPAKYIIHAVSPRYMGGDRGEEAKLRSCYKKSLRLAKDNNIKSVSFPLISTGGFGYPKEEGMRIAVDEINAFLLGNDMEINLVVFDAGATLLGEKIYPDLEEYIDCNYVDEKHKEEYRAARTEVFESTVLYSVPSGFRKEKSWIGSKPFKDEASDGLSAASDFAEVHETRLEERMLHISDTFSQYLMYLIKEKNLENADVWKRAIVDRKIFSKIKNNINYHPNKLTALCLCVGAKLNLDESKDLLARAGYALSPCDKTDIIFSYFIENEIYDMIELDIQLEEHGLPCIIT